MLGQQSVYASAPPSGRSSPPPSPATPPNGESSQPLRPRWGGNHLPPSHPARGRPPRYERRRALPPDPERRDRNQRNRTRRAIALAQETGALSPTLAAVLSALLNASDDRLTPGWWSLAYIARLVYGPERYAEEGTQAGQRTAGRWMAALMELGWLQSAHRWRFDSGRIIGTSNLWRIDIPTPARAVVLAGEDRARTRSAARRPRPHQGRVTYGPAVPTTRWSSGPKPAPATSSPTPTPTPESGDAEPVSPEKALNGLQAARAALRHTPP